MIRHTQDQYIALVKSVNQWKKNCRKRDKGQFYDTGRDVCPCCKKFGINCTGCPIREYTGQESCAGTPFERVEDGDLHPVVMYKWLLKLLLGKRPKIYSNRIWDLDP